MEDVLKFINNLNIKNETVIAAISGGPDSMMLLDILLKLRNKLNLNIVVAHVHHNLRKESDEEAIMVENYCKNNDLIFELYKIEKYPDNKFSEVSARKERYEFFDRLVNKYKSNYLFTAHHGDDLIETILMRISRGSSLKGYAGFEKINKDRGYNIVRPLVYLTKQEIEKYLKEKNIEYAVDQSNKSDKYTRNRYRNNILPILKQEYNDVHYKYIEFNNKILLADFYLKNEAEKQYKDIINNNEINVLKFNKLDEIIKIYVLEKYLKEIYGNDITEIKTRHIDIIIFQLKNKYNKNIDLPLSKKGILEYDKFKIVSNISNFDYEYTFNDSIKLNDGSRIYIDNNTIDITNYVIHLNSSEIKMPFHVRNRRNGDVMKVKNMHGHKKINNIFIDSKLEKEKRNNYPIVTDDNNKILWIPGIKKSDFDRKKSGKYDIILKYELKEENNG